MDIYNSLGHWLTNIHEFKLTCPDTKGAVLLGWVPSISVKLESSKLWYRTGSGPVHWGGAVQLPSKQNKNTGYHYRPQRSCGQGNISTPVCRSVHRGGLPQCMLGYPPPGADIPPEQTPSPLGADPPGADTPHWEQTPPTGSRHHPGADHPPGADPPGKQTPAYGLRAAGTHPTGMHSCLFL